jgi:ABC-type transport system involved in multi-copper enzyme maturation permease subunit
MVVIFRMTLRQLIRVPLLWWMLFAVMVISEFAPSFAEVVAWGNKEQSILDCAQATAWAGILMSVVMSTHMILGKELDEKVALTLFVKPLSPSSFLFGKYFALLLAASIIFVIQSLMVLRLGWIYNWSSQGYLYFFSSMLMVFFQGMMLLSVSVLMNCWLGNVVSIWSIVIFWSLCLWVPPSWNFPCALIIPLWTSFDLSEIVFKNMNLPWKTIGLLGLYALSYSTIVIGISAKVLARRQY